MWALGRLSLILVFDFFAIITDAPRLLLVSPMVWTVVNNSLKNNWPMWLSMLHTEERAAKEPRSEKLAE